MGLFYTHLALSCESKYMMASSNGNIFRLTGHMCGEFTRSPVNSPHKGQWRGALMFSLICAWINRWVNNGEAGDFRCYRTHYDVIVMALRFKKETSVLDSCNSNGTSAIHWGPWPHYTHNLHLFEFYFVVVSPSLAALLSVTTAFPFSSRWSQNMDISSA